MASIRKIFSKSCKALYEVCINCLHNYVCIRIMNIHVYVHAHVKVHRCMHTSCWLAPGFLISLCTDI